MTNYESKNSKQSTLERIKSEFSTYVKGLGRGNTNINDLVKLFFRWIEELMKKFDIEKYKELKSELWYYIDGFTRGNWGTRDELRKLFKNLEVLLIGDDKDLLNKANMNNYALL